MLKLKGYASIARLRNRVDGEDLVTLPIRYWSKKMMKSSEKKVKILAYLILIGLLMGIYFISPHFYKDLFRIIMSGNMQEIAKYISSFGAWAMFFGFILVLLINIVGLPSIFAITANGLVFGPYWGVLISWIGESIGVIFGFLLMRTILRSSAEKLIAHSKYLKKLDEFSGKNGFQMMVILRSLPYFPSGALTAFGALSKIGLRDYCLASFIGKLPSTVVEVFVGYDAFNYKENMTRLIVIVGLSVIVYGGIWYYNRKRVS